MTHAKSAPTVVTPAGGVKFVAEVRGHRILVDQPPAVGDDEGPAPLELLGVALGTCIAYYVRQFCVTRNLPVDGLLVEVESETARNPYRVARFKVLVVPPAGFAADQLDVLHRVAMTCPAHNTLVSGATVDVQVEVPMAHSCS
jgi:putative redox protein